MTDRAQFEAMLEALINEDHESAKEIFHNIVVGKSREIYAELLESDFEEDGEEAMEDGEEAMEEEAEEEMEEDGEEMEEEGADDEESDDEEGSEDDSEEDPFGGDEEEGGEGDMEDRVMDLEDALEDLKAEFEQLMAGEEAEEHDHPGIHDMGGDDMGMDDMGMDEEEGMPMMEYVNQVGGKQYNQFGKMGDNGTNTKSIVAKKNDMGGTTANIAKSFSTEKGGTQGGLLNPSTKPQDGGNINKPGANAGKTAFKKREPGHGAEKAGAKESPDNKTSMLNGAPKRAK